MLIRTHTTGIHYTDEIVEWAVLRKNRAGTEKIREGANPIPLDFFEQEEAPLFPVEPLAESRKEFKGIVTVALPSAHLLMRVLELPSTDPAELQSMVELQLDQICPYPLDQMARSYEVLKQDEEHSRVLAVAAQRTTIDDLGDLFKKEHLYIRSLDAEILAWWSLLITHGNVPLNGRVILILEEHTEFSLIVVDDASPICFRSLELFHDFNDESVIEEIIEEIRYTLLSLETAYGADNNCLTEFWNESGFSDKLIEGLKSLSPRGVNLHDLNTLPTLAEGLALRSADRTSHHAEMVPREWVELQRRKQLMKIGTVASIALMSIWFAVVSITGTVFAVHKASLKRIREEANRYAEPARAAQNARIEKESLEKYADRSHAILECLLEITDLLPESLELNSFNYTKGKAIQLRGSGQSTEPIYDYFQKLGASELFNGIQNEKQSMQIKQGQRQEGFSVTVQLPELASEENEQ